MASVEWYGVYQRRRAKEGTAPPPLFETRGIKVRTMLGVRNMRGQVGRKGF